MSCKNTNTFLMIGIATILIIVAVAICKRTENLSLSQFPIPNCSTCKNCTFYTCGKCGTIYQEANKINQTCDCGGFTVYKTRQQPSCYKQTLKGNPNIGKVRTCKEHYKFPIKSVCQKCTLTCPPTQGTFESGSTFARDLPCPVTFPPVLPGYQIASHKQSMHVSDLDIHKALERNELIIAANDGNIVDYVMKKLIEQTQVGGNYGYPDFYNINGPVVVMTKVGRYYYWMIDYPIKYTPDNYSNYVNRSENWNIAKTMYHAGRKLLNANAPFIFFSANRLLKNKVKIAAAKCMPTGHAQSNTDYYYPGCNSKSCLWGPDYGDGNWLLHV